MKKKVLMLIMYTIPCLCARPHKDVNPEASWLAFQSLRQQLIENNPAIIHRIATIVLEENPSITKQGLVDRFRFTQDGQTRASIFPLSALQEIFKHICYIRLLTLLDRDLEQAHKPLHAQKIPTIIRGEPGMPCLGADSLEKFIQVHSQYMPDINSDDLIVLRHATGSTCVLLVISSNPQMYIICIMDTYELATILPKILKACNVNTPTELKLFKKLNPKKYTQVYDNYTKDAYAKTFYKSYTTKIDAMTAFFELINQD